MTPIFVVEAFDKQMIVEDVPLDALTNAKIRERGQFRDQIEQMPGELPTQSGHRHQKLTLRANWTIRGLELKLRTLPKSGVLMSLTGLSRFG